jgi:hypothetical protein
MQKIRIQRCISNYALHTTNERFSSKRFLSSLLLRLGPIQHLEQISDTRTHPRMGIRFGTFDVIMQVISEEFNLADAILRLVALKMSGK